VTTNREFILAADPVTPGDGRTRREIMQRIDGGRWQGLAQVDNRDAYEVLETLRRVYQSGREDHAEDYAPGETAAHFSPDEIEALIITAADAVHGERSDLSRRQLALGERAWQILEGR
jgi:hypothetical protein